MNQVRQEEKSLSIKDALKYAWQSIRSNYQTFAVLVAILILSSLLPDFLIRTFFNDAVNAFTIAIEAASFVIDTILWIGVYKLVLDWHDKKKIIIPTFKECLALTWKYILASLLYMLVVVAGLILLVIPGIYWAIKYGFSLFVLVDKNTGVFESFTESSKLTKGHLRFLFLFGATILLIGILEGVVTRLTSFAITAPLTSLATVYIYRKLQNN